MITQRQYMKSENSVALGASFCSVGRRPSASSASIIASVKAVEMPMKLEERLNELESNAVKALLSLGEAFVSQSPYRAVIKKQPEPLSVAYVKPLQPHQQLQHQHPQTTRSVIVKAEPTIVTNEESRIQGHFQQSIHQRSTSSTSFTSSNGPGHGHHQNHYVRELESSNNGHIFNNHQSTIRLASSIAPNVSAAQKSSITTVASPVSIQPIVSAVSSSSPMISTIFYQIPATAASSTNGNNGSVMSSSFTLIPAPNGRTVIPLPMVTTSATQMVKLEPSTVVAQNAGTATPVNWNNIQLLKVPRSSIENGNGLATFSTLAPIISTAPAAAKLLPGPSPGKAEGKSLTATPPSDGKSPTKSRARRRSQSTTKGQSRSSRVSSSSSTTEFVICPSVEGLPNIVVDGYEISREIWAKAFLQNDIIHAAATLFNALFSSEEIKNCTLNGRNGTRQLCPEKRHAIFSTNTYFKTAMLIDELEINFKRTPNKCQDPYSFNKCPEDTKILNREEQMMIDKKVFVERRYQTNRKIRDLPSTPSPAISSSVITSSVVTSSPASVTTTKPATSSPTSCITKNNQRTASLTSVPVVQMPAVIQQRRDSGSFSSICGDDKGIPKIALLQSSEIIANYFQSAEPLPLTTTTNSPLINKPDGPPPLKMQKVG